MLRLIRPDGSAFDDPFDDNKSSVTFPGPFGRNSYGKRESRNATPELAPGGHASLDATLPPEIVPAQCGQALARTAQPLSRSDSTAL